MTTLKTTYTNLSVDSHLSVRLPDGRTLDAIVARIGPVDQGWAMLTLHVPGVSHCYLAVSELELA